MSLKGQSAFPPESQQSPANSIKIRGTLTRTQNQHAKRGRKLLSCRHRVSQWACRHTSLLTLRLWLGQVLYPTEPRRD